MEFLILVALAWVLFQIYLFFEVFERRRQTRVFRERIDELEKLSERLSARVSKVEAASAAAPMPRTAGAVPAAVTPSTVAPSPVTVVPPASVVPAARPVPPPSTPVPPPAPSAAPPSPPAKPPELPKPPAPPHVTPTAPPRPPMSPIPQRPPVAVTPGMQSPPPRPAPAFTAPAPPAAPRRRITFDVEEMLGANWFGKLGVIIMVLGIVFYLALKLGEMSEPVRVLLGYAIGFGLLGGGVFLERKERYRMLARGVIGGGWALVFFMTFAMHFVEATKVIPSAAAALVLLLLVAVAMVAHTLRYNSQLVTGMAFLLAFTTVAIGSGSFPGLEVQPNTVYSLSASAVLAAGLVAITRRRNWFELEVFGLLASYLNHFFWLRPIIEPMGDAKHKFPEFVASTALLLLYWAAFRWSYIFRDIKADAEEKVSTVAALLNTSLLMGLMKYQSPSTGLAFYVLLILGLVEMTLAWVPAARRRRPAFVILTIIGSMLVIAAPVLKYNEMNPSVLWVAEAQALLLAGVFLREILFRRFALLAGLLASGNMLVRNAFDIYELRLYTPQDVPQWGLALAFAFVALLFYLDAHWIPHRWRDLFTSEFERKCLRGLSYVAGAMTLVGAWLAFPNAWTAVAWAVVALALAYAGRNLNIEDLAFQAHVFAAFAFAACLFVNTDATGEVYGLSLRLVTMALVAALLYLSARWCGTSDEESRRWISQRYTFGASILVAALLFVECNPKAWIAVAWLTFGLVLSLIGLRWNRAELCLQTHLLALGSFFMLLVENTSAQGRIFVNPTVEGPTGISLRLVTMVLAAALCYLSAKWCGPRDADWAPKVSMGYTSAGSLLVALLFYLEFTRPHWIAVAWAAFALLLVVLGRWLKRAELPWQAHLISLVALVQVWFVNLEPGGTVARGISLRLLTVGLVAGLYYTTGWLSGRLEFPGSRESGFGYSWAGSFLVSLLMWYELRPINISLGWALFGLVLFELGFGRSSISQRLQSYLAMAAAFAHMFYVNLNAETAPGEVSARLYTTLPLALVFFYAYSRFAGQDEKLETDRRLRAPALLCYFGAITVAALLRFEIPRDWVIAGWAGLVLILLAASHFGRQNIFLHQGYLLAFAVLFRAALYNFAQPKHDALSMSDSRMFQVGAAVALLFLGLAFAFPLRKRLAESASESRVPAPLAKLLGRPEQVFFFAPLLLLMVLQWIEVRELVTIAWGITGIAAFMFALWVGQRSFRLAGLGLLLLCIGKLGALDTWDMAKEYRYVTFISIGATLVLVSFLYNKFRERIRQYL